MARLRLGWRWLRLALGRLRWRFSLAMVGLVVLTTLSIGWLATYSFNLEIELFVKYLEKLDPKLVAQLDQQFGRYEVSTLEQNGVSLDRFPELIVPLVAPFVVAIVVALVIASRVAKPLEAVSGAARRVAQGDFSARAPLTPKQLQAQDESTELARNFNAMAAALERLESERKATTAAIAHELRTPLTVLRGRLQAVHDGVMTLNPQEVRLLLDQTETLTRLVDDLKTLSLAEAGQLSFRPESVDLVQIVRNASNALHPRAQEKVVRVDVQANGAAMLHGDPERLTQVFTNLLENALRHTPQHGLIGVRVAVQTGQVCAEVRDTGPGIPEAALPHVFERFYRSEPSRARHLGGSGLGLAVVKAIVDLHQGQVSASNHSQGGALISLVLPMQPRQA